MNRGKGWVVSLGDAGMAIQVAAICLLAYGSGLSALEAQTDRRIHVEVVVTDSADKPVSGLRTQDFKLVDDGNKLSWPSFAAYDGVQAKADPPVQMILVIDCMNNGSAELGYIRQGLVNFLRQNSGHLVQPTTIVRFSLSEIDFLSQPSTDGNALANIVDQIGAATTPKGLDLYSVSLKALVTLVNNVANQPARKMVVWLGPGWPVAVPGPHVVTAIDESDRRADYQLMVQLAKGMEEGRIALYGGYKGADFYVRDYSKPVRKISGVDPRDLALEVLAAKSGGQGKLPVIDRDSAVSDVLNDLVAEAGTFYSLSFDPPRARKADEFHRLKVQVDKPRLTVHAITGYYDEPEYFRPEPRKEKTLIAQLTAGKERAALRQMTVAQLIATVENLKGKPDVQAAKEIDDLQLTERLSSPKLAALSAQVTGPQSKSALMGVGDASVFLEPPKDEIPQNATPDLARQKQIMSLAVDYLKKINPKLPDFYAKRFTTSFEAVWTPKDGPSTHNPEALNPAGEFKATVYYRGGREVLHPEGPAEFGLITQGTFGPILNTVMVDAAHSTTDWSRWEEGPNGPMAVYRFQVPQTESHYQVSFPTFATADDLGLAAPSAYHGEFAIDPHSGAILRLVLEADPDLGSTGQRADIMVEYGAVTIGGKGYTCPVRSVSVASGRSSTGLSATLFVLRLDDVVFSDYHMFRSEMRILPE